MALAVSHREFQAYILVCIGRIQADRWLCQVPVGTVSR
jgi:hypothetical protein